jgi:hypothetical protein
MNAVRLWFAAVTLAASMAGQGREAFLGITQLRGTISFSLNESGKTLDGWTYSKTAEARATFTLTRRETGVTPEWRGLMTSSSSSATVDAKGPVGFCERTDRFTLVGPLQQGSSPNAHDVAITMSSSGWTLLLSRRNFPIQTVSVPIICTNGQSRTGQFTTRLNLPPSMSGLPYPASGTTINLNSTYETDVDYGGWIDSAGLLSKWRYQITIEPGADDLKLELESSAYKTWRPTATRQGDPGTPLQITATVRRGAGMASAQDVRQFEWELVNTSKEPGVAINWPRDAHDSEYDLKFDPQADQVPETANRQKLIQPARSAQVTAVVLPYDWGAWSTLKVTAVLIDGRKLVGRLIGASEDDLRLPKRTPDSLIADDWKEQWSLAGKGDRDDSESDPVGDGNEGDGLTLYEEYRGFYENMKHQECNPKLKDYFALNTAGADVDTALQHFGHVTGLLVHYRFLQKELSSNRVINANYDSSPHLVDQHGVRYKYAGYTGFSRAVGGPSTPGRIEYVGLSTTMPVRPTTNESISFGAAIAAHEALHTVNVWHHGQTDKEVIWLGIGGMLLEFSGGASKQIRAFNEAGVEQTAALAKRFENKGTKIWLGEVGGQHSGVEDCLMRYTNSAGYRSKTDDSIRYYPDESEMAGTLVCTSANGTGVNAPPLSRYLDAKVGNCAAQILVNDRIPAPTRE